MSGIKGAVSQEILKKLLLGGGAISIASRSSYFWAKVYKNLFSNKDALSKKKVQDIFYYLKKKNLITFDKENKQLHISLTPEGEKEANKYLFKKDFNI